VNSFVHSKLNIIIETMNERHECFVSEMTECGVFHEIDPSLSSPIVEVNLYDDYESSPPLEPNCNVHTPFTGL